jgi:hypothetical protein
MLILRSLFLIIFFFQFLFAQEKDLNLPNLGDRVSGVISLEQERILGPGFFGTSICPSPFDK